MTQFLPYHKVDSGFQTPPPVCDYMTSLIQGERRKVLEPTPGLGNLVRSLQAAGHQVTCADNFFLIDKSIERWDYVVMNPPFSTKTAFLDHAPANFNDHGLRLGYFMLSECMTMSDNIIALMPWFTLTDSDVRMRVLKSFGMKSLTALPRKTFQYARIQTVVIELQKGFQGETIFKTFEY